MYEHKENVPMIKTEEDLKQHLSELYVIYPYMSSEDRYVEFQEKMYDILKGCFHVDELRKYPIKFKFYPRDKKIYTMEIRHFIIHIFMWYSLIPLYDITNVLDEDCIANLYVCSNDIEEFINTNILPKLKYYNIKDTTINTTMATVRYNIRRIPIDFSLIMNLQFSFFDFWDAYNTNPRIKEIMECTFDAGTPLNEIEATINAYQKEIKQEFISMKGNPIGAVLAADTGVKEKQLGEYTVAQSLKPDLDGNVIPIAIENSTLIRGLDRPSYYYIDAGAARKSLVMNKKVMGNAGYFGKIVLLLARTLSLSKTMFDCGSQHYVEYDIISKKFLKKLNGKFYLDEEMNELKVVNSKKDAHLIGQKIKFRSAATCCCSENKVCSVCFGRTASLNFDIADGVAGYESEEITKVVNQAILSAKHLLTTKSEVIKFNDTFDKFFTLSVGDVYPKINDTEISDLDNYAIYIPADGMVRTDEMDDDSSYNTYIKDGMFYVVHIPTGEMTEIKLENDKELYPTDTLLDERKRGKGYIKFKDLDDSDRLFEMPIQNDELTKPLYELMHLINRSKPDDRYATIDAISQKFVELLVESGIDASAIAAECIINRLIRSVERPYERPDFSNPDLEDYEIYEVSKALEKNKSPLIGMAYQDIKRQMLSDEFVTERNGTSYVDHLMKPHVSNLYKQKMKRKHK